MMRIKSLIKIFIAAASIYLLSKYDFLDFSYLLKLDVLLSVKIIGTIIIIIFLRVLFKKEDKNRYIEEETNKNNKRKLI